jgi:hypothetical protein
MVSHLIVLCCQSSDIYHFLYLHLLSHRSRKEQRNTPVDLSQENKCCPLVLGVSKLYFLFSVQSHWVLTIITFSRLYLFSWLHYCI